jgi:hypothetical protein
MSTERVKLVTSTSTSPGYSVGVGTSANTGAVVQPGNVNPHGGTKRAKAIEAAVYGHIRAVRALGRNEITTVEIANALNLSESAVLDALAALESKGVKKASP